MNDYFHNPCTSDCASANHCVGHRVECCKCGKVGCPSDFHSCDGDAYCDEHWAERCEERAAEDQDCSTCANYRGGEKSDCCDECEKSGAEGKHWVWNGEVDEG